MIAYTPEARRQVDDLAEHYERKQRPEAVRNLGAALARAETLIENRASRARAFPATYRSLARPGRAWLKEGIYWIAFEQGPSPVIVAVFWEQAAIERRYPLMT